MKRLGAAFAGLALAGGPAAASPPGTGTLTALTSVDTNCSVSTTPLAFGAYDPILAHKLAPLNAPAPGAVTVACVRGSAPNIGLNLGTYPTGSTRRMRHASTATEFLTYELYKPSTTVPGAACAYPGAAVWGATGLAIFAPGAAASLGPRTFNVCGTVFAGQNAEVGTFSDTVIATIDF
jgi:spore coat protein U domain-containing protein, fimbrial subunit CupE1/2/3/6